MDAASGYRVSKVWAIDFADNTVTVGVVAVVEDAVLIVNEGDKEDDEGKGNSSSNLPELALLAICSSCCCLRSATCAQIVHGAST
jgi:organic hydroperoxide reductase OsmC/OhrA